MKPTHIRKGDTITELNEDGSNGAATKHKSINAAKRESRAIQAGSLGQGKVQVVPHKPPTNRIGSVSRTRH